MIMEIQELNLKVEAMDINDHHHSLPVSDEDCQMMPLIDDDDEDDDDDLDMDSEEEEEDVWDQKPKPKREVYEVEAKVNNNNKKDDGLVKFPINYCSTTKVKDIKKQVAQLLGLEEGSFMMRYVDAEQDLIRMITRENLMDALSVVDSSASNVLHLDIKLI